jgi:hypothetical protein
MNWLKKYFARLLKKSVSSPRRAPRPQRVRPQLELLEDRVVPTIYNTFNNITSPNGLHTAAVGQDTNYPGSYVVIEDGKEISPAYGNVYNLQFSPNSWHLAYDAMTTGGFIVADYSQGPSSLNFTPLGHPEFDVYTVPYYWINSPPQFSADSSALSFVASGVSQTKQLNNPTSIAVTPPTPPSVYGQPVTFTATVTGLPGTAIPTADAVEFFIDGAPAKTSSSIVVTYPGNEVASLTLNSNQDLAYGIPALSGGSHTITAQFLGDPGFYASQMSAPVVATVTPAASATTLSESLATSVYGQTVSLTATVKPTWPSQPSLLPGLAVPSGSVSFYADGNLLGTANVNNGQAVLSTASLPTGSHSLTARYNGSADYSASQASPLSETVTPAQTTLALSESAPSSTYGGAVSFTATVSPVAPGAGVPTGAVSFLDNGSPLGTSSLNAAGQAVLSTTSLLAGSHVITAAYAGSPNFSASPSTAPLTETVSLSLGGPGLPLEIAGQSYSTTLSAAGGSGTYRYSLATGSTLPGTLAVSPAGVLSGVVTTAGTYGFTVLASDVLLPGVSGTQKFILTVNPGAPAAIAVSTPASATAGTAFAATITVKDAYGNGCSGPVSLSASDGDPALPASATVTNGSTTLNLTLRTAGTVTLTAAAGAVKGSSTITINPAAMQKLVVSNPGSVTAGTPFTVTVSAQDQYGNTVTSQSGPVTLISGDSSQFPNTSLTLSNGTASRQVTLYKAEQFYLEAYYGSFSTSSGYFTVNPAAMTVSFSAFSPSAVTAGGIFSSTITIKDQYGNGYNGTVYLSASDGQKLNVPSFTMSGGSTFVNFQLYKADTITLTATAGSLTGTSSAITISPASVSTLAVSAPSTATAGSSFNVTVTAVDPYGNTVTGFNGNVALSCTDGQSIAPTTVSLASGVGTAAMTLYKADTLRLFANNGVISGYSGLLTVSPAALTIVVSAPSAVTAGVGFYAPITIKDAYGNGYNGPVTLSTSDGQTLNVTTFTMSNGYTVPVLVLYKADTITLTATAGSLTGSSSSITINPAAAVALAVSAPSTASAGSSFNVTVRAQDPYGNTVTSITGNASLSSTDGQSVLPNSVALSNGTGTAVVTLDKAGTLRLFASNGVVGGYSGVLTVSPAALTVVISAPSAVTAGVGFNVPITIKDAYGNGYNGPVTLSTSDGQTLNVTTFTMSNGYTVPVVVLYKADTITLTATAGSLKGTSGSITINPAAAVALAVRAPSTATAGTSFNATVTAVDPYGNTVTGFNGTVSLKSTDGQSVSPATVTLSNGTGTATVTLYKADSLQLFASNGVISGYSGVLTVSPAAMNVVVSAPSTVTAGVGFSVTITIKDAYGNGYNGPVTLSTSDGQTLNVTSFTMVNGSTTAILVLDIPDNVILTATAGTRKGSSNAISVI